MTVGLAVRVAAAIVAATAAGVDTAAVAVVVVIVVVAAAVEIAVTGGVTAEKDINGTTGRSAPGRLLI
jgi:hypothetical protein